MSKLEVREIGPISGETEVRLADGATAVGFGGGKVLQYKHMTYGTETRTTSNNWLETGFELDFTPKSDSSVIRISASLKVDSKMKNSLRSGKTHLRFTRDGTTIYEIERGYYMNSTVTNEDRSLEYWVNMIWNNQSDTVSSLNYKLEFNNGNDESAVFATNHKGLFEITEIEV